jgi:hypothetical protein
MEVYEKWGRSIQHSLGGQPSMMLTRARALGPLAGVASLGGGLGFAAGGADRDVKDAAVGAMLFLGLSNMAAKKAARLMMNQSFSKWATSAPNLTVNAALGSLTRLGMNMQQEPPEVQQAFLEFLFNINDVSVAGQKGSSGGRQQNMGVIGNRAGLPPVLGGQ